MEPRPGEFDFSDFDSRLAAAEAASLKMLAILDYDTSWIHESSDGRVRISEDQLPHWLNFVELDRLLESGAADLTDVISIHTYGLSPAILGERAGEALEKIRAAGFKGSLWVTETGVPTGGFYPHAVAPGKQGAFMVKTLITSWAAGADKVFLYTMFDSHPLGEGPQRNLFRGLLRTLRQEWNGQDGSSGS